MCSSLGFTVWVKLTMYSDDRQKINKYKYKEEAEFILTHGHGTS